MRTSTTILLQSLVPESQDLYLLKQSFVLDLSCLAQSRAQSYSKLSQESLRFEQFETQPMRCSAFNCFGRTFEGPQVLIALAKIAIALQLVFSLLVCGLLLLCKSIFQVSVKALTLISFKLALQNCH